MDTKAYFLLQQYPMGVASICYVDDWLYLKHELKDPVTKKKIFFFKNKVLNEL